MNVEIGAEAALFPEKEYINGIAFAVHYSRGHGVCGHLKLCTKYNDDTTNRQLFPFLPAHLSLSYKHAVESLI